MEPVPAKEVEPGRLDGVAATFPLGAHLVIRSAAAWGPATAIGVAETFLQVVPTLAEEAARATAAEVPASRAVAVPGSSSVPDVVRATAAHTEVLATDLGSNNVQRPHLHRSRA